MSFSRELGGTPREETVEERAARLEREIAFQGDEGVRAATAEVAALARELESLCASVAASSAIKLEVIKRGSAGDLYLVGLGHALGLRWSPAAFNSLVGSSLQAILLSHLPAGPGQFQFEAPSRLRSLFFRFDLLPGEVGGWLSMDPKFSTKELAEHG